MEADRQKLVDRILKLLALADSTTFEAEAATARRLAQELMDRHNVNPDTGAVDPKDRTVIVIQHYTPHFKGTVWEFRMASAAAKITGCAAYYWGQYEKFGFVGRVADVEAAHYIVTKLHEQRIGEWLRYKRTGADSFHKFSYGFSEGVSDKVNALTAPMAELQNTIKTAQIWFAARYTVKHDPVYGRASSDAGTNAGAGVSFHRGELGSHKRQQQRLLR